MPGIHAPIGRERELAELVAFLSARAALPAALLVAGDAGMGKTTVWRWGVSAAGEAGYRVLEARPVEAETGLSYSALSDLLDPVVRSALPALPEPQRRALESALLLRPADGVVLDQRAVGTALLGVLRLARADGPLLLAVDDVQWMDGASTAALAFALRRLRDEPVATLLARRTTPGDADGARPGWLPAAELPIGPLSLGATHALVFERLGAALPRPLLRRLHDLSRGNPFYALELTRAWQAGRIQLADAEALPPGLADLLGSRIASLPAATRRLLAAAAASPRPTLGLLTALDGGTDPSAALGPAIDTRIIEAREDAIRFAHPLLAASAYAAVDAAERRRIHAGLAALVPDGEERARHLALATIVPDAAVAALVEAAASTAFRRGALASAADLMGDAARLTPPDAADDHHRRVLAEAEYRFEAGETERARALMVALVDRAAPGPGRAALLSRLARVRHFGEEITAGVQLLREALPDAGDDPRLRVEIEEGLVWGLLLIRQDLQEAERHGRSAVEQAGRLGEDAPLAEALAAHAMALAMLGRDPSPQMTRALALEPATLGLRVLRHPSFAHGYLQQDADELGPARDTFLGLRARAEAQGDDSSLPPILNHLSVIACLAGEPDLAAAHAEEGHALALQSGQVPSQVATLGRLALALATAGDLERSRASASAALALADPAGRYPARPEAAAARGGELAIWALGRAALAAGDPAEADRQLGPLVAFLLDAGVAEPGEIRPLADAVEALATLGRLDEATRMAGHLGAMGERTGRPSVLGLAARAQAVVAAAAGDLDGARLAAEAAVAQHRASSLPVELARSLVVLGATQRRQRAKRDARASIDEALGILDRTGARGWIPAAEAELARVGGRARAGDADDAGLTPSERRAAELVADGHSNKEIAALMFVSPKTVEANLSRVYAKLGLASRTELVRRLASERANT